MLSLKKHRNNFTFYTVTSKFLSHVCIQETDANLFEIEVHR
jgi:hypothetical protein